MELFTELAQTGLLGLLLAISVGGNIWQYKQMRADFETSMNFVRGVLAKDYEYKEKITTMMENIIRSLKDNNV